MTRIQHHINGNAGFANEIRISKSPTADTRTCDRSKVTKATLRKSSEGQIQIPEGFRKVMAEKKKKYGVPYRKMLCLALTYALQHRTACDFAELCDARFNGWEPLNTLKTPNPKKGNNMKQYIGTKIVKAEPMDSDVASKILERELCLDNAQSHSMTANGEPIARGYLVEYPDGYKSWSPKKQFEEAYREMSGINTLQKIVENITVEED